MGIIACTSRFPCSIPTWATFRPIGWYDADTLDRSLLHQLRQQVLAFSAWAETLDGHYGEWELEYEHAGDLTSAALAVIAEHGDDSLNEDDLADLLYSLARDNEGEVIRGALVDSPVLLAQLAGLAVSTAEADARWQIAVAVAEAKLLNAAALMRPFLDDESEYVRRRALLGFAQIAPEEAEAIALRDLDDPFEYTRLAALEVLRTVDSDHLDKALDLLVHDVSQHVRIPAEELRWKD